MLTSGGDSGVQGNSMQHEMILADGSRYPYRGRLYAVNRQVDTKTGTLQIEAIFPNPGNLLRPGQFVRIVVTTGIRKGALLVPQRAVMEQQGVYQVAIIRPDRRIEIRQVQPGDRSGDRWIIDAGVAAGETVVAEGVQKVHEGTLVSPMPYAMPASPDPVGTGDTGSDR